MSSNIVAVFIAQLVGLLLTALLLVASAESMPPGVALAWAALAGVMASIGLAALYLALSRGSMGLVAPLTALIAATIPALVGLLNGESLGPVALLGMVTAVVAVVVISLPDGHSDLPGLAMLRGSRPSDWLLILVAGLGFAGFYIFIDAAHDVGGEVWWPLFSLKVAAVLTISAVALMLVPLGRSAALRLGGAALLLGVLAGIGDFGGNLFFVLASAEGGLALVVVLASLYPVATVLLARVVLHERLSHLRVLGVALAIAGVVLISIGSL